MAKIKVDMTGVEAFSSCEEGVHPAKIVDSEIKDTNNGDDMIILKFEVLSGPSKGARVKENFPLTDNARWKLKQLLDAIGMKSDGKLVIDTDKLMEKRVIIEVALEEYNSKKYPKIQEFKKLSSKAAAAAEDDDEEEDEEETPKSKKPAAKPADKAKPKKKPVEEEDEDEDDEEEEPVVKKSKKPEPKPAPKKKPVVEEDDEDDDEDEEPVQKKKPASKKPDPKAEKAKKKPPVDDDDDEEWDEED